MKLHITENIYVVEGYPFLFIEDREKRFLILGDIHLGQTGVLNSSYSYEVSTECRQLLDDIKHVGNSLGVTDIIINGDTKHATTTITLQEKAEFDRFVDELTMYRVIFIRGNHDETLGVFYDGEIVDSFCMNRTGWRIQIAHGHASIDIEKGDLLILSHEHPAYTFHGESGVHIKERTFVTLYRDDQMLAIILPAANTVSSGVSFPPDKFLSPILNQIPLTHYQLFPFSREIGVLPLPKMSFS